ncbi:MAG: S8 family serine peptidase [Theionarchaea archaeon]|nr:S8 family serine peptidase [Theionarchaea archaeon]
MVKSTRLVITCTLVFLLVASGINYEAKASGPHEVQLTTDKNKVMLRAATVDVRFADNLKGVTQLPVDGGYYLVHFADKLDKGTASKLILAISQGNVMKNIAYCTYLCRLDSSHMGSLNSIKEIDWIGLWKSEYKIHPHIYETIETTVTSEAMTSDGEAAPAFNKLPQPENEFIITLFAGENASEYISQIEALGGFVRNYTFDRMFVHIKKSKIPQIAALNGVYFVERRYLMAPVNDNDTWIVQTYQMYNWKVFNNGVTGSGQVIAVSDTGVDADHLMFWDSVNGLPSHTYNAAQRKVLTYYNWYQTGNLVTPPPPDSPYYDPGDGYFPGAADPMYNVYDWDYQQGHGSHVCGTAAGEWELGTPLPTWGALGVVPTAGYDFYEGNAYGAKLVFQDLSRTDSPYIYPPPDMNDNNPAAGIYPGSVGLFPQAMADGAYIHSNSWGGGGFGEYGSYSQDIDEMMWANPNFLVIFSNGNDGPGATTITPPATAKDCLSIGAAETSNDGYGHNSENVASFSSWGPTGGWGRVKPDVCAPGYYIFSAWNDDDGVTSFTDGTTLNDGLTGYGGTSMSAPGVAGCCALVRQYFMTGFYTPVGASTGFFGAGAFTPTAAMMKATIIQSAQPMTGSNTGGTIPGQGQGWGRVLLDNALYFAGDTGSLLVDDNTTGLDGAAIVQPFFKVYTVSVAPGQVLDVTCAYSDPPGTAGSAFQMVNYLYVEVDHPNGIDYYLSGAGNFSGGQSVKNTGFIYPDTVQKVRINNPDPGLYTIFVVAFQTDQVTPGWNVQPYALTVCGNLVQSQGYVQFDQDYYGVTGPLTMTLTDGDLAGTGTATVSLSSASTGDSEANVTLTEVGGASGIFQGTFPCDPVAGGAVNDGILNVGDPDTLTVTYNDVAPVGVRTDTAQIDGVPPVISNVAANACNGSSVEITWDTDENSDSVVHWGTTPAYGNTVSDANLVINHFIQFDGLQMGTTYYYEVCSTDQASNTACSGPHQFTTPLIYTPPQYHAGYVAQYDYGTVLDDDDMWTGHNTTYAGIRHGVFQFVLSDLPCYAYIRSVQIVLYKQDSVFDDMQADTWSCNFINFFTDLYAAATYDSVHNAQTLLTLTPTWTTAQLAGDALGTAYVLTVNDPVDIANFNPRGGRALYLTFRLDGATTGDDIMSWDTGYRQDIGSIGVCYKPQLIITYDLTGQCTVPSNTPPSPCPSLCPLAKYNIGLTQDLKKEAEDLLAEAQNKGLDTSEIEEILAQADEYLEKAQQFCLQSTNCIAGNWNALKAMELYKQAIDKLKELLG